MRFTIVTPSLNQLDWLRLCVASVRDQVKARTETGHPKPEEIRTNISVEHIVQDAGTLGIEDFAREHGAAFWRDGKEVFSNRCSVGGQVPENRAKDKKVKSCREEEQYTLAIFSETDAGMYDAINKGLRRSTGDICAYLNCDEQYLPGALKWVSDYLERATRTDALFGATIVTLSDGSYVCDRRVMVPTRWHTLVSGNLSIFTSSTFFRRAAVVDRDLLFDPQWRVCGDAVWALQLIEAGLEMEATDKPLSAFAETGSNLSASGNARAAEEIRLLAGLAPDSVRVAKPLVLLAYRLRRWWSGAYKIYPHSYSVYTVLSPQRRQQFDVVQPTFRWRMGAGGKTMPCA